MHTLENPIEQRRRFVQNQIQKSFDNELEKAHQDGDMHPNGKWVWVSSANGGKGDWRVKKKDNGASNKQHSDKVRKEQSWDEKKKEIQKILKTITLSNYKQKIIDVVKQYGFYENLGQSEIIKLKDKYGYNPYGTEKERKIADKIDELDHWVSTLDYSAIR